jgi:hypothetical protein
VRESVEEETDIKPEKEVGRNHLFKKIYYFRSPKSIS